MRVFFTACTLIVVLVPAALGQSAEELTKRLKDPDAPTRRLAADTLGQQKPVAPPDKGSASAGAPKDAPRLGLGKFEKYLPAKSGVIQSFRLDRIRSSPLCKALRADDAGHSDVQRLAGNFGLEEGDVDQLVIGVVEKTRAVIILSTTKGVDLPAIAREADLKESAVGSYKLYAAPGSQNSLVAPEPGLYIIGNTAELQEILKSDDKSRPDPKLKKAIQQADFSKYAVSMSDPAAVGLKTSAEWVLQEMDLTSEYSETCRASTKDAETALQWQDSVEKEIKTAYGKIDGAHYTVSVSGSFVVAKITVSADGVKQHKEKFLRKFTPGK